MKKLKNIIKESSKWMDGEFQVFVVTKSGEHKILKTFKSGRAAKTWYNANVDKYLSNDNNKQFGMEPK